MMTGEKGEYIVANYDAEALKDKPPPKHVGRPVKYFNEDDLAKSVERLPVYPGGNSGFQAFIDQTSRELVEFLPLNLKRTYVMIEFIIDKNGKLAYAKVIKGGNDELNDHLQEKFENMPDWKPASRLEKNVAIKLKQSIVVERGE